VAPIVGPLWISRGRFPGWGKPAAAELNAGVIRWRTGKPVAYTDCVKFDWDPRKAASNIVDHDGVTFEEAREVFDGDPLTRVDARHAELRFQSIGPSATRVLLVVWTERDGDVIRIISARKATPAEKRAYRKHRGHP
jgi:uncharacterized DUF497 family protein